MALRKCLQKSKSKCELLISFFRNYNFSGLDIKSAMRESNRPAAPPSSTRWSKLNVRFASITGTNCFFASSQLGARRPAHAQHERLLRQRNRRRPDQPERAV